MIKVDGITKEFKNNKKYPGFRGAIKSFFSSEYEIKMMTGILTPTSGEITVDGLIPYEKRQENAKNIGVVFGQKTKLWWDLPLSETFSLLKEIYDVSDEDFNERMKFLNDILGFNDFLLTPVRSLSLGQRMRADIAASLLHNPKVVYQLSDFAKYPMGIYPKGIKIILTGIIPFAFTGYFPGSYFLGKENVFMGIILTCLVSIIALFVAYRIWLIGISKYESSGS